MKIAYILPALLNQGPIIVVKNLIEEIIDKVDLIEVYYFDNVTEIELPCYTECISINESIDFDKFDVIHTHMLRPDFYMWKNQRKISKAIWVSTLHQDIKANLGSTYNKFIGIVLDILWPMMLNKSDSVVFLTNVMKRKYEGRIKNVLKETIYNGRKIDINHNLLEDDVEKKIFSLKKNYKIIGVIALLTKRKGVHQILQSLLTLTDYSLVVIGNGKELVNLIEQAEQLGLTNRCLFTGYIKDAYKYLPLFDVFVMSSYSEGFVLSVLEAAIQRKSVVCSDIELFREIYPEEVVFFELDNIESLATAINEAYNRRDYYSNKIYNKVIKEYSSTIMSQRYLQLYKKLLNTPR